MFDRHLGLQLLNYAQFGQFPDEYDSSEQQALLSPLLKLISEDMDTPQPNLSVLFEVMPAILKKPDNTRRKIYYNPYDLTDWLPNAFMSFKNIIS